MIIVMQTGAGKEALADVEKRIKELLAESEEKSKELEKANKMLENYITGRRTQI
ncbi:MAG: hypothetical protein ACMUIA_09155 [bacterium]